MKTVKIGLDIGNSSVKGIILSEQNALLKSILIPSAVNWMHDERTLSYPDANTRYVQVLESPWHMRRRLRQSEQGLWSSRVISSLTSEVRLTRRIMS